AATLLGDAARALPALEASTRLTPDDYAAHILLASAYNGAGRRDDALAEVARGLALSPGAEGRTRLLIVRASALARAGDPRAAAALDEAASAAAKIAGQPTRDAMLQRIAQLRQAKP